MAATAANTAAASPTPTLLAAALASAASCPQGARLGDPDALAPLPEELLLQLLRRVIAGGRLTPRIAGAFAAVAEARRHQELREFIAALALRDPPALVKTTARPWLGDRPSLY